MFEYLMPLLVMPTYENTLLDQTYRAAVERQIEYGKQRGVPWGMSESGYNTVDVHLNYQYRAFGVPGSGPETRTGRRSGRRAVRVGACPDGRARGGVPQPATSCRGWAGRQARLVRGDRLHAVAATSRRDERGRPVVHGAPPGDEPARPSPIVLLARPMQKRFESDPLFQATLLLLQERIPRATAVSSECRRIFPTSARPPAARRCRCACSRAPTPRSRKCSCCRTAAIT